MWPTASLPASDNNPINWQWTKSSTILIQEVISLRYFLFYFIPPLKCFLMASLPAKSSDCKIGSQIYKNVQKHSLLTILMGLHQRDSDIYWSQVRRPQWASGGLLQVVVDLHGYVFFFSPGTCDLSILRLSAHISIILPHYFCPAVMKVDPQSPSQDSNVYEVSVCPDWGRLVDSEHLLDVRIQCCLMQYDDMISSKQSQTPWWCHFANVM